MPITQVRQPVGPLTNQRIFNVQNAQDVYRLLSSAAHEDVSCLTLRPIEYRPLGESLHVTFGGGCWPISFHFGGDSLGNPRGDRSSKGADGGTQILCSCCIGAGGWTTHPMGVSIHCPR